MNARDPDFLELVNHNVATIAGFKSYLPPRRILALRSWTRIGNETVSTLPDKAIQFIKTDENLVVAHSNTGTNAANNNNIASKCKEITRTRLLLS